MLSHNIPLINQLYSSRLVATQHNMLAQIKSSISMGCQVISNELHKCSRSVNIIHLFNQLYTSPWDMQHRLLAQSTQVSLKFPINNNITRVSNPMVMSNMHKLLVYISVGNLKLILRVSSNQHMVLVHLSQVTILLASSIMEDNILCMELDIPTTILQLHNPLVYLFTLDHSLLIHLILHTHLTLHMHIHLTSSLSMVFPRGTFLSLHNSL